VVVLAFSLAVSVAKRPHPLASPTWAPPISAVLAPEAAPWPRAAVRRACCARTWKYHPLGMRRRRAGRVPFVNECYGRAGAVASATAFGNIRIPLKPGIQVQPGECRGART